MRLLCVLVLAVALLAGCGSDESEPDLADTLTGATWITEGDKYIVFRDAGDYGVGTVEVSSDVSLADREWGTWSVDGNVLTKVPDAGSPVCAEVTSSYTIEVVDDGERLETTVQDDECEPRHEDFSRGLTRVG